MSPLKGEIICIVIFSPDHGRTAPCAQHLMCALVKEHFSCTFACAFRNSCHVYRFLSVTVFYVDENPTESRGVPRFCVRVGE
jgi:hypothetical protein